MVVLFTLFLSIIFVFVFIMSIIIIIVFLRVERAGGCTRSIRRSGTDARTQTLVSFAGGRDTSATWRRDMQSMLAAAHAILPLPAILHRIPAPAEHAEPKHRSSSMVLVHHLVDMVRMEGKVCGAAFIVREEVPSIVFILVGCSFFLLFLSARLVATVLFDDFHIRPRPHTHVFAIAVPSLCLSILFGRVGVMHCIFCGARGRRHAAHIKRRSRRQG